MQSVITKKTKLEIPLPEGWHDVKFNNALDILINANNYSDIKILSILSGVDEKVLNKETDLETIHYLLNSLLFLKEPATKKHPEFPNRVLDKTLPFVNYYNKFDLGGCQVGQVEDMKLLISEAKPETELDIINLYPKICAIYLQPIMLEKDYDYQAAMYYSEHLSNELDYKTAANMGAFFLTRLGGLTTGYPKRWRSLHLLKRKSKQVLGNLVQRLVSMLP